MRPYMSEPWYALLRAEVERTSITAAALRIGVSRGAVSQVLNGTGLYGTGEADTRRFGLRVMQMLSKVMCPFLTQTAGEDTWISGDQCRGYAYRECPTNSSLATRHWTACRGCPTRVSAPRGWDEQGHRFIEIKPEIKPQALPADDKPGVAAPDQPRT
jgi:hypothetical protein